MTESNKSERMLLDFQLNDAAGIDTWKSCYDGELPACLLEMCESFACKLCGDVSFQTPMDAAIHYVGKKHNNMTIRFLGKKCGHNTQKVMLVTQFTKNWAIE